MPVSQRGTVPQEKTGFYDNNVNSIHIFNELLEKCGCTVKLGENELTIVLVDVPNSGEMGVLMSPEAEGTIPRDHLLKVPKMPKFDLMQLAEESGLCEALAKYLGLVRKITVSIRLSGEEITGTTGENWSGFLELYYKNVRFHVYNPQGPQQRYDNPLKFFHGLALFFSECKPIDPQEVERATEAQRARFGTTILNRAQKKGGLAQALLLTDTKSDET